LSGATATWANNLRWESTRLARSRRVWLLVIPVIAGPVGSALADEYLRISSTATAQVLGFLVTAGLASLVVLDLTALAVGEELAQRTHLLTFSLPQGRAGALGGRLLLVVGSTLGAYAVGAAGAAGIASLLVSTSPGAPAPILVPLHLYLGSFGLLLFLAGVAAAASAMTRSASQGIVAGVLAGVVAAGGGSLLLLDHQLTYFFPLLLGAAGVGALGWAVGQYTVLEA
jgi:ABC-type transport system involved in multi-copper enzyme maturation permease subunit